jgi:antitoxin component of MazEF toxin-antitoxin module
MPQLSIVAVGDSAALLLPAEILESLKLQVGDKLDATLGEQQLILRPVEDAARRQLMQTIVQEVFERRRDAYQRLA